MNLLSMDIHLTHQMRSFEVWKDIPGFEGHYQASSRGRVRSLDRLTMYREHKRFKKGGIASSQMNNRGYLKVDLYLGSKRTKFFLHRVIAITFIPNPDDHPIVNHLDRDRTNNRIENLEWCNGSENQLHWREAERAKVCVVPDEPIRAEDIPW